MTPLAAGEHECGSSNFFQEVVPETYNELIETLMEGVEGKPRYSPVYRGQANAGWALHHTLQRFVHLSMDHRCYSGLEEAAIAEILKHDDYMRSVEVRGGWLSALAFAQHHGCPTRLLDWTEDLTVAIHFATCSPECNQLDGAVWMVSPRALHSQLPDDIRCKLVSGTDRASHRDGEPSVFDADVFFDQFPVFTRGFDVGLAVPHSPFLFVRSPLGVRGRAAQQRGLFSVSRSPMSCMSREMSDSSCVIAKKVVISPELKIEARRKLDAEGMDELKFFPELDGVGMYLRRQFWSMPEM